MIKKFLLLLISGFYICTGLGFAVELSLNDAVKRAIKNSDDMKVNNKRLDKVNSMYKEVRASVFPQVSGAFGWDSYIKSPTMTVDIGMGPTTFSVKQDWEMSAGINLNQVLWAFGRVYTAVEIAHKAINVEKLMLEATSNEIEFGVRQAYYTILFARQTLNIAQESHSNALRNQAALEKRYRGGRISRVNNIKMETDVAVRMPMVLKAQASLDSVLIGFKNLLNINRDEEVILKEDLVTDFPDYQFEKLKSLMIAREPMLKLLSSGISLQESIVKLRKVGYYPTLAGFMSYNYRGNSNDIFPLNAMQSELIAGVRLNMTLFDYGVLRHKHQQAVIDKDIASINYDKHKKKRTTELTSALSEYSAEVKIYEANKTAQELAQESYEITLSSFESGVVSQSMLNDVELGLTSLKIETLSSLYKINILMARIEKLTEE